MENNEKDFTKKTYTKFRSLDNQFINKYKNKGRITLRKNDTILEEALSEINEGIKANIKTKPKSECASIKNRKIRNSNSLKRRRLPGKYSHKQTYVEMLKRIQEPNFNRYHSTKNPNDNKNNNNNNNILKEEEEDSKMKVSLVPKGASSSYTNFEFFINNNLRNLEFKLKDNRISTTKYNLISFIPKGLLFQFARLANVYFLFTAIIQSIPLISPLSSITAIVPLIFVLGVSMIREGIEDLVRNNYDNSNNNEEVIVFRNGRFIKDLSKTLRSGEIVIIYEGGQIPADMVLIDSGFREGSCYVETSSLDGEKTLKLRIANNKIHGIISNHTDYENCLENDPNLEGLEFSGFIQVESPNSNLNQIDGKIIFVQSTEYGGKEIIFPITPKEFLLKGSILKNTNWIAGVVIYTGMNNKIILNSKKPRMKISLIEISMNHCLIGVFFFLIICCIICSISFREQIYKYQLFYNVFINFGNNSSHIGLNTFITFFTYFLLLNTLIPISLIVTIEIIKMIQGIFIEWDVNLYSKLRKFFCKAKTVSINEELGNVNFIFSDKTGTLTMNQLEFRYCLINQNCYKYVYNSAVTNNIKVNHTYTINNNFSSSSNNYSSSYNNNENNCSDSNRSQNNYNNNYNKYKRNSDTNYIIINHDNKRIKHNFSTIPENQKENDNENDNDDDDKENENEINNNKNIENNNINNKNEKEDNEDSYRGKNNEIIIYNNKDEEEDNPDKDDSKEKSKSKSKSKRKSKQRKSKSKSIEKEKEKEELSNSNANSNLKSNSNPNSNSKESELESPLQNNTNLKIEIIEFSDEYFDEYIRKKKEYLHSLEENGNLKIENLLNEPIQKEKINEEINTINEFWKALSITNECLVDGDGYKKDKKFIGTSPDDLELVKAAYKQGYKLVNTSYNKKIVRIEKEEMEFEILNVLSFSSERKRMSIIFREPNGTIKLYIKGADCEIIKRLSKKTLRSENYKKILNNLDYFSKEGYRTLLVAYKELKESYYNQWLENLYDDDDNVIVKNKKIESLYNEIENNLELLGTTVVEDKLQDEVPQTIKEIKNAGIKIWVLTGDKMNTVENIGLSCNLLTKKQKIFKVFCLDDDNEKVKHDSYQELSKLFDDFQQFIDELYKKNHLENKKKNLMNNEYISYHNNIIGNDNNINNYSNLNNDFIGINHSLNIYDNNNNINKNNSPFINNYINLNGISSNRNENDNIINNYSYNNNNTKFNNKKNINNDFYYTNPNKDDNLPEDSEQSKSIKKISKNNHNKENSRNQENQENIIKINTLNDNNINISRDKYKDNQSNNSSSENDINPVIDWQSLRYLKRKGLLEPFSIIIEGPILCGLFKDEEQTENFLNIAYEANTVICCRVSPIQKSQVVQKMKQFDKKSVTLAIGDGSNDVSMLMEANIGIGICGEEGMSAVQASDFAIGEFRQLKRLLFFHGRTNLNRISKMILYFFYKNVVFTMGQIYFAPYNLTSGQTFIDDWYITCYNLIFTALPLCVSALTDIDVKEEDDEEVKKNLPLLYKESRDIKRLFTGKAFLLNMLKGGIISIIIFYICIHCEILNYDGDCVDLWHFSLKNYISIIICVSLCLLVNTHYIVTSLILFMILSTFLLLAIFLLMVHFGLIFEFNSKASIFINLSSINFFLHIFLLASVSFLIDYFFKAYLFLFSDSLSSKFSRKRYMKLITQKEIKKRISSFNKNNKNSNSNIFGSTNQLNKKNKVKKNYSNKNQLSDQSKIDLINNFDLARLGLNFGLGIGNSKNNNKNDYFMIHKRLTLTKKRDKKMLYCNNNLNSKININSISKYYSSNNTIRISKFTPKSSDDPKEISQ